MTIQDRLKRSNISYVQLQPLQFVYLFFSGAVAITAMVLPGISGSSIPLIAGVYLPTIQAVHNLMALQLNVLRVCAHWDLVCWPASASPSARSARRCRITAAQWCG